MATVDVAGTTPAGEMIVGEPIDFSRVAWIEIVAAPPSSTAQAEGGTFVPDVPGVFTFRLSDGVASFDHRRVAFPREALDHPVIVDGRRGQGEPHWPKIIRDDVARRIVLRKIAGMGRRSLTQSDATMHGDATVDPALFADDIFNRLNRRRPIPVGFDIGNL